MSLAAYTLKRPVRMALDRDEDMILTGGRNPFLFKYKVAFNKNGEIKALDIKAFCNAGFTLDISDNVMFVSYMSIINSYRFGSIKCEFNGKFFKSLHL